MKFKVIGKFQIVLLSIDHFGIIYQYTSNQLPILGDLIELIAGKILFQIENNFLLPVSNEDYSIYLLCGSFIGETSKSIDFNDLKNSLIGINVDVELNSYGRILFPT